MDSTLDYPDFYTVQGCFEDICPVDQGYFQDVVNNFREEEVCSRSASEADSSDSELGVSACLDSALWDRSEMLLRESFCDGQSDTESICQSAEESMERNTAFLLETSIEEQPTSDLKSADLDTSDLEEVGPLDQAFVRQASVRQTLMKTMRSLMAKRNKTKRA